MASRNSRETSAATPKSAAPEEMIRRALALMPLRQRLALQARWAVRSILWNVLGRLPGYVAVVRALSRVRRQGVSGLWEPCFSPRARDTGRVDRRIPWHGWGVLAEGGGYRAYTPTAKTAETWRIPEGARAALWNRYHRGSLADFATWVPLAVAPVEASPRQVAGDKSRGEP